MQDKTINNALIALRKAGGSQGMLAEVLLDMRGVPLPSWHQREPFKRGKTIRAVLGALRDGPKTSAQVGDAILAAKPTLTERVARNRAYQALQRLKAKVVVVHDGRFGGLWWLAPLPSN